MEELNQISSNQTSEKPSNAEMYSMIPNSKEEAEKLISFWQEDDRKKAQDAWSGWGDEEAPTDEAQAKGEAQPEQTQNTPNEFAFEIDGKTYKFNQEDLQKTVAEGLKATNKYQELIQQQQQFMQEKAEFEKRLGQYDHLRQLDNWAKENPELYNRLALEHEAMKSGAEFGQVPPYVAKLATDVNNLMDKIAEIDQLKEEQKIKNSNEQLEKEIATYKQNFADFDWNSKDQSGLRLEQKIINHAISNNIGTFRAAANDYLMSDIVKRQPLKAKEEAAKIIQKNNKLGIQPKSEKYIPSEPVIKGKMTYEKAMERILKTY